MPFVDAAHALAVRHLGTTIGTRIADLARPGYRLERATAGRSRFGGPALLEPGTAWPWLDDIPLTLLAVLDLSDFTDLRACELPADAEGLVVNVFHGLHNVPLGRTGAWDDPRLARVLSARTSAAVEVQHPAPATAFELTPVRAVPVVTLPDVEERAFQDLILGPGSANFDYDEWNRHEAR